MRCRLIGFALVILMANRVDAQAPGAPKTAYTSSQRLLAAAPGSADADAQLKRVVDSVRAEEQRMGDSLTGLVTAYARDEATLSADAKATRQQVIRDRQAVYTQRQQQLEAQAQQRRNDLLRPITDRIRGVLEAVRREQGYAIILDSDAGGLLAADSALDVTDRVIARLQAAGATSGIPPTEKSPAGPTAKPSGIVRPRTP